MNKYKISFYRGSIIENDGIVIATQVIEGDYELTSKKIIKASKELVERLGYKFDKWYRVLETTKDKRIDIDFGSYTDFIKVELMDD